MSQYCTEQSNGKWKNNASGKLYDDMAPCILEGVSKDDMVDEYNSTVDDIKNYLSLPKSDFFKKYGLFLLVVIVLVVVYFMFFKK